MQDRMQTGANSVSRMPLKLRFLGTFESTIDGKSLPKTRTRKEGWLLGLLTIRGSQPTDRSWLAGTLWPDSSEEQALAYLRSSLYNLRRVLGAESSRLVSPSSRSVMLNMEGADVDVIEFDRLSISDKPIDLERAVEMYRGDLLEGCDEPWAIIERERRREGYLLALESLGTGAAQSGDPGQALRWLRQALACDALRETAVRGVMCALDQLGDRAGASLAFRQFRLRLSEELRTSPSPQTTALYQQIRSGARASAALVHQTGSSSSTRGSAKAFQLHHRFPIPATALVGRERELSEVRALLLESSASVHAKRIVTLTGSGGIGKTRLAVAVTEAVAGEFANGVSFVDLSALSNGELLSRIVAEAIGVREEPGRTFTESLSAHLADKEHLLLLDNCEHILQPCAWLAEALIRKCSGVRILATSRQAFGSSDEAVLRVPALGVPPLDFARYGATSAELLAFDSVRLFVERAMDASGLFALTDRNAQAIVRICQRVDGLPLALELAAARVNALSVEQIALRLDESAKLLTRGSKAAPTRQQSLTALIDWSYELLGEAERSLFRRLSIFSGGWSLDAAEKICADADPVPCKHQNREARVGEAEVLDLLSELIDRSLVVTNLSRDGSLRYRYLETIRQFAASALHDFGERESLRDFHVAYFVQLVEEAESGLEAADQQKWLDQLETEHDNIRVALARACERNCESSLRMTAALRLFWDRHGDYNEGRKWCAAALETNAGRGLSSLRANTLKAAGLLAFRQADYASARDYLEKSLAMQRELGDLKGISAALTNLAIVAHDQGDFDPAILWLKEALEIDRRRDDRRDIAISLTNLSNIEYSRGSFDLARTLQEEALVTWRAENDPWRLSLSLGNLGSILFEMGEVETAQRLQEESLEIRRKLEDPWNIALALANLGNIAHENRELSAAKSLHEESLILREEVGHRNGVAYSLNCLAKIEFDLGHLSEAATLHARSLAIAAELKNRAAVADALEGLAPIEAAHGYAIRAAKLWGAADRIRRDIGNPPTPSRKRRIEPQLAAVRTALAESDFETAWGEGNTLSLEEATALCLSERDF
jgi:non-specific serine/threonine protein kinase